MKKLLVAGIATAAFCGAPALAADMAVKAPPPSVAAPAYSWTGFYVGANGGYGWGGQNVNYSPNDPASALLFAPPTFTGSAPIPTHFDTSGGLGGVQIGYNWQFNRNWLVGFETDFDWSGIKGSGTSTGAASTGIGPAPFADSASEKLDWFGTVRARLGYLPMDNLLTYVTGGFAYGRIDHSGNYGITGGGVAFGFAGGGFGFNCNIGAVCFAGSSSSVVPGWTAGAGFEFAAWGNVTIKAEYLYLNLDSKLLTETALVPGPGLAPASFNANYANMGVNIVRVGLDYRFH